MLFSERPEGAPTVGVESFAQASAESLLATTRRNPATIESLHARVTARIAYFIGLPEEIFAACYDDRCEPTEAYLAATTEADGTLPIVIEPVRSTTSWDRAKKRTQQRLDG